MEKYTISVTLLLILTMLQGILMIDDQDAGVEALEIDEFTNGMSIMNVTSFTFNGNRNYHYYGKSLQTGSGDINGDGFDDLVIGDGQNSSVNPNGGVVNIYFGSSDLKGKMQNISNPDVTVYGAVGSSLGDQVCIPGDLNNDGIDDLVMASPWYSDPSHTGKASIMFGRTEGWSDLMNESLSDVFILSENFGDYLGSSLCGPGDMNGDGIDDLVIGANYCNSDNGANSGKIYLFFGRSADWKTNMTGLDAEASFIGNDEHDYFGIQSSRAGDVNGDGLMDLITGTPYVDGVTSYDGEAYLILGAETGWARNTSLDNAVTSIKGMDRNGYFGRYLAGGHDINGDGLSDIVISANGANGDDICSGKAMVFFGRTEGWSSIEDSEDADVTITGRTYSGAFGVDVCIARDINSDGLSDLVIGERDCCDLVNYSGAVFFFFGRTTGWEHVNSTEDSDASIHGENMVDYLGSRLNMNGDMDGDGKEELMIVSDNNDDAGYNSGKIYCISSGRNFEPTEIYDLQVCVDEQMTSNAEIIDRTEWLYIELRGQDGNTSLKNTAYVNISLNQTMNVPIRLPLRETDADSGIYRGKFRVPVSANFGELITITSVNDGSKFRSVIVDTPVLLAPVPDMVETDQYSQFSFAFENLGYSDAQTWDVEFEEGWLEWSRDDLTISGYPNNVDIGAWDVSVNLSHPSGKSDSCDLRVKVLNTPPSITTEDVTTIEEGQLYYVDYNSTEDSDGNIQWSFASNASFLTLDKSSGLLSGEPSAADIGWCFVRIWVTDGNGADDTQIFNLTVTDRNDPPEIITKDVTQMDQGETYYRRYEVRDPDPGDTCTWSVVTDADWLSFDEEKVLLTGTPGPEDVGVYDVEVKVTDRRGLSDMHQFKLTVININDAPTILDGPNSLSLEAGELLSFDVNAEDPDEGDLLTYKISSEPDSDISIDQTTGVINWKASTKWWDNAPYVMEVTVKVEDQEVVTEHTFNIEVLPSTPPNAKITSPGDGSKISPNDLVLQWSGFDLEEDPLTYAIYLGETRAMVDSLKDDTLLISDLEESSIELNDLEPGKQYYWTVIPNDGCSDGCCSCGVMSFKLNKPPKVEIPDLQEVVAGEKFRLLIKATDDDQEDWNRLSYSLRLAPEGMSIEESSGVVVWNPGDGQDQMHQVIVNISDGTDVVEVSFTIEVLPGEGDGGINISLVLVPAVVSILVIGLLLFLLVRRKKDDDVGGKEIEIVEEQVIGGIGEEEEKDQISCDVALSPSEAHAHLGKGSKQVSYEDLYGASAPAVETGPAPTATELRDQIREEIDHLERMEE